MPYTSLDGTHSTNTIVPLHVNEKKIIVENQYWEALSDGKNGVVHYERLIFFIDEHFGGENTFP